MNCILKHSIKNLNEIFEEKKYSDQEYRTLTDTSKLLMLIWHLVIIYMTNPI